MITRLQTLVKRFTESVYFIWLAIALGPFILVGKDLVRGRVLFWGTPALQFVPWWTEAVRQLLEGQFPLWNMYNGMGAPLLANYQTAFFYPPNWFLIILGIVWKAGGIAWGITFLAMLHLVWGGMGMAALLSRLHASRFAQILGGMVFALCGYFVGRLEFYSMVLVGAWLPWLLLGVQALCDEKPVSTISWRNWLPLRLTAILWMMLLAGHAQLTWYGLLLAGAWLVVFGGFRQSWRSWSLKLARFAFAGLAAGVGAAVQLLPTAEYLLQSQRASAYAYETAMTYSFWPWRLVSFLAPNFFGNPGQGNWWGYASYWEDHFYLGILPAIFVIATIPLVFKRSGENLEKSHRSLVRFLWVVILTGMIFALGSNLPVFPFLYKHIQTFNMFQAPARYLIWVTLAGVLLFGLQVDRWRYPSGKGLYWLRLGTAGAFAVSVGAGLGWLFLQGINLTFIQALAMSGFFALGTGILALLLQFRERWFGRKIWPVLVYLLVFVDLLVIGWNLNPMLPVTFYSQSVSDADREEHRILIAPDLEYFLKITRFLRFDNYLPFEDWGRMRTIPLPNLNMLDRRAMVNNFDPFVPGTFQAWMDHFDAASLEEKQAMLVWMGVDRWILYDGRDVSGVRYQLLDDVSQAAWFSCATRMPERQDELNWLSGQNFRRDMLVVSSGEELPSCRSTERIPLKVTRSHANEIIVDLQGVQPGWIFISETDYPGWRAWIDGAETEIYRAETNFMAVRLPNSARIVRLNYVPNLFVIGGLLSILFIVGLIVYRRSVHTIPAGRKNR